MMILITFALVFIVIYLYYTITDVRKAQKEMKKLTDEVAELKTTLAKLEPLSKEMEVVKAKLGTPMISLTTTGGSTETKTAENIPDIKNTTNISDESDEVSSVSTEEVRETLNCTDDEEDEIVPCDASVEVNNVIDTIPEGLEAEPEQNIEEVEEDNVDLQDILDINKNKENVIDINGMVDTNEEVNKTVVTVDDIQKMKYDDLREFCRKHDISTKGTKDVLIKRICETLGL
jgi:hypothetical protein